MNGSVDNVDEPAQETLDDRGVIVCLIPDVFFSVSVRNAVRSLGYDAVIVAAVADLTKEAFGARTALAIVDMAAVREDASWSDIAGLESSGVPVLAFGPHRDVEAFRRAKDAGVARVVANSQFHREMPDLIARYALPKT